MLELPIEEACEEAIAQVAAIRVRRTRAMIAAERARGEVTTREYDGGDLVTYADASAVQVESDADRSRRADEPAAYDETTEEPSDVPPTPGYEHVRTTTGPTGLRVSHYRPVDEAQAAPRSSEVRDPAARRSAVERVREHAAALGLEVVAESESVLVGPSGNHEFFLHLRVPGADGRATSARGRLPGAADPA